MLRIVEDFAKSPKYTTGHWKRYHSIAYGRIFCRFDTIHECDRQPPRHPAMQSPHDGIGRAYAQHLTAKMRDKIATGMTAEWLNVWRNGHLLSTITSARTCLLSILPTAAAITEITLFSWRVETNKYVLVYIWSQVDSVGLHDLQRRLSLWSWWMVKRHFKEIDKGIFKRLTLL